MPDPVTRFMRRLDDVLQGLLRGKGQASPALAGPAQPAGDLLPDVIVAGAAPLPLDRVFQIPARLLVVEPHGGNASALVAHLAERPPTAPLFGVRVPREPGMPPVPLLADQLAQRGHKVKTSTLEQWLRHGHVVWLIEDTAPPTALLDWLDECLAQHPQSSALVVTPLMPRHRVTEQLTTAAVATPTWQATRAWLDSQTTQGSVLSAHLGAQSEAREAVMTSAALRTVLCDWTPSGDRLAGLYRAWAETLRPPGPDGRAARPPAGWVGQAAGLAWQAQLNRAPFTEPPAPSLASVIFQSAPRQWTFNHPALQHHLAAQAAEATAESLRPYLGDPAWREVLALWAAHADGAAGLLDAVLVEVGEWRLPASTEAPTANPAFQAQLAHLPHLVALGLRMVQEMGSRGKAYEHHLLALALGHLKTLDGLAGAQRASALIESALADHQGMGETTETGRSLIALAGHADPAVRAGAVGLLYRVRSDIALRELRARLSDENSAVGLAAAEALGRIGPRALDMLMLGLSDPRDSVRERAIVGLSEMGQNAVPVLSESLTNRDPWVVEGAARALGRMDGLGIPALIQALGPANSAAAAREALIDLGRRTPEGLVAGLGQTNSNTRDRLFDTLRLVGPVLQPALLDALRDPNHSISDLAIDVLADNAPQDPQVIASFARGLGDKRLSVRRRCEQALIRLGPAVLPVALDAVADRPDLQGRLIELADQMPAVTLTPPLVQALLPVLHAARTDVRLVAVRMLANAPDPQTLGHLTEALRDADPSIRIEAARGLANATPEQAVPALQAALEEEPDAETRAELLQTLGRLDPGAAVDRAIIGLGDPSEEVHKVALATLRHAGPKAVDPLIEAICQENLAYVRPDMVELLGELAARAKTSSDPAYGVARVWHTLLLRRHTPREARERAAELSRWRYGPEVQRAYTTAETFHKYSSVRDLEDAPSYLYWIHDETEWLRPEVQAVLRELGRLATQAKTNLAVAGLETLAAGQRREGLKQVDSELVDLENRLDQHRYDLAPFIDVIQHWRDLVGRAIIEASGEADLVLLPITDHVRLHNSDPLTVAVCLKNVGDGSARYVRVTLDRRSAEQAGLGVRDMAWDLPELEARQVYRLEFGATVQRDAVAALDFHVRYEDANRALQHQDQTVRIRFYRDFQVYRPLGLNPYIAGPPIKTGDMFFGRHTALNWVVDHLIGKHGHNVLILYGERRTGKTSLLYQIERLPNFANGQYIFALVDFQDMSYWMNSTPQFYYGLAQRLTDKLVKQGLRVTAPSLEEFGAMPGPRFDQFVEAVIEALGDRTLVVLLDEFDLLLERFRRGDIDSSVEDHIRALFQHQTRLAFIFTGAHAVRAMLENPHTILFNTAFRRQIGFLEPDDAYDLIRRPVAGQIEYDEVAVERLLDATHGHPYFIQYICHYLFDRLKNERRNFADMTDVTDALREVVQDAMGNIANGYAQLRVEHKLILVTLAKATLDSRRFVRTEEVFRRLEQQYKVVLPERERERWLTELVQRDFIETEQDRDRWLEGLRSRGHVDSDQAARPDRVDFTMDLVRIWLINRVDRELRDLIDQWRAT